MTSDVGTVMWKEARESLVRQTVGGGGASGLRPLAIGAISIGILFSWTAGRSWTGLPAIAVAAGFAGMAVVSMVPDSFAGERDRKTLETLLTSRLPDRSILLGKVAAAALIAVGAVVVMLLVAIVTVNVHGHGGGVIFYTPLELGAALGSAALVGLLCANVGVLASLRAPSVLAAQRALMLGLGGVIAAVATAFSALPDGWKTDLTRLADRVGTDSPALAVAIGAVALLLLNWAVFCLAVNLFRRPKLVRA